MQPIIRRLHTQSQHVFLETNSGVPPRIHNDIFRLSNQEDDRDDLLVFSGKTTTVTTKARSNAGSCIRQLASEHAAGVVLEHFKKSLVRLKLETLGKRS